MTWCGVEPEQHWVVGEKGGIMHHMRELIAPPIMSLLYGQLASGNKA
jgi:hypothetical protein